MKITVKEFNVEMELKNKGMEFEVREPDGAAHLGDVLVNKTGLTWCKGRTTHQNGAGKRGRNSLLGRNPSNSLCSHERPEVCEARLRASHEPATEFSVTPLDYALTERAQKWESICHVGGAAPVGTIRMTALEGSQIC